MSMASWHHCKNLLCVRLDNMGDLLMSSPAISALKRSFKCKISLLTSTMAQPLVEFIPDIDESIVVDIPWVKTTHYQQSSFFKITAGLREKNFDGAVIFTTFSQNPLPAAMLLYDAGIRNVLAYCRENPYNLISNWIPELEPYRLIRHQVQRDLDLVRVIGAHAENDHIVLQNKTSLQNDAWIKNKLTADGIDLDRDWIIIHPGVSEEKRRYDTQCWIEVSQTLIERCNIQIVITGSANETQLAETIAEKFSKNVCSLAGKLDIGQLIDVIRMSSTIVSVNTVTSHLAAAVKTPMVVLYALTNPQHSPWKGRGYLLPFSVREELQSRNEVLRYLNDTYYPGSYSVKPQEVVKAVHSILYDKNVPELPELVLANDIVLR
jgi:ADP-heptose:LPS heptosyltransferase